MARVDIVLTADYAANASIPLPSDARPISSIPTATQYLQGIGGLLAVTVTKVDATHVSVTVATKEYNILKLVYVATGEIVRT